MIGILFINFLVDRPPIIAKERKEKIMEEFALFATKAILWLAILITFGFLSVSLYTKEDGISIGSACALAIEAVTLLVVTRLL